MGRSIAWQLKLLALLVPGGLLAWLWYSGLLPHLIARVPLLPYLAARLI